MAIYTLSARAEGLLASLGACLALLARLRLFAFASGLSVAVIFTLIRLLTEGTRDLPFHVFSYYLVGEGFALLSILGFFRRAPITLTIHAALSVAWIIFLFRGGLIAQWLDLWSALRLPGA